MMDSARFGSLYQYAPGALRTSKNGRETNMPDLVNQARQKDSVQGLNPGKPLSWVPQNLIATGPIADTIQLTAQAKLQKPGLEALKQSNPLQYNKIYENAYNHAFLEALRQQSTVKL